MEDNRPDRLKADDWEQQRDRILRRDGRCCVFCGIGEHAHENRHNQSLHVHHVIPRYQGGSDHPENLATVCSRCHKTLESITDHFIEKFEQRQIQQQEGRSAKQHIVKAVNELTAAEKKAGSVDDRVMSAHSELVEWIQDD